MKRIRFLVILSSLFFLNESTSAQAFNQLLVFSEWHYGFLSYPLNAPAPFPEDARVYGSSSGIKFQHISKGNFVWGGSIAYTQKLLTYAEPISIRNANNTVSLTIDGERSQNISLQIEAGYAWRINRQQQFILTGSVNYMHFLNNEFRSDGDASVLGDPVSLVESLPGVGINPYWQIAFKKGNSFGLSFGLPIRYLIDENTDGDLQLGIEAGVGYRF
jgi:hypothetical protein